MAKKTKKRSEYVPIERDICTPSQVKAFRAWANNMTREEFADLLGVTPAAVVWWETGQRKVPNTTARLLKMFAKYPQLMKEFGNL